MFNITLGEWAAFKPTNGSAPEIWDSANNCIAKVRLLSGSESYHEAVANAKFICLCANQCQLVNKDHPEYVAEKIGELIKALRVYAEDRNNSHSWLKVKKVLSEIERGE